jgi:hypothetical protein
VKSEGGRLAPTALSRSRWPPHAVRLGRLHPHRGIASASGPPLPRRCLSSRERMMLSWQEVIEWLRLLVGGHLLLLIIKHLT